MSEADNGAALVHCRAGCSVENIVRALGLKIEHLGRPSGVRENTTSRPRAAVASKRKEPKLWSVAETDISAVHPYGADIQLVRFTQASRDRGSKKALPRFRDAGGNWRFGLGGTPAASLPLYREDEALEGLTAGDTLYIAEGESDADAIRAAQGVATTNFGGATKFQPHHAEQIASIESTSRIVVLEDNDEAGRRHVRDVVAKLCAAGVDVERIQVGRALAGKDARDHLEAGHGLDDLDLARPVVDDETLSQGGVEGFALADLRNSGMRCINREGEDLQVILGEAFTDRGMARRIEAVSEKVLRWVPEWRCWAVFDGQRWRRPADEEALARAQALSDVMIDARHHLQEEAREKLIAAAMKLQNVRTAKAALEAAKPILLAHAADFDDRADLLNAPNGTLDLRTLELHPHRAADRLTLMTAAQFERDATCDLWDRVLATALPDLATRLYLQKLAGLTLAGHERRDLAVLIYGPTRTSKGTVQGAMDAALGDYAATLSLEELAESDRARPGAAAPGLVKLQGPRMVSVYETGAGLRLNAALLKTMTGSDPLTVRDLYAKPVTFVPQFTLWLATNHRPGLPADDDAVWERIRELPFHAQIPAQERDPRVRARLSDASNAGAAVLAWAAEGLRKLQEEGLETPTTVAKATGEYRSAMDDLVGFADDHLVFGEATVYQATPKAIRAALDQWTKDVGGRRVSRREIDAWLEGRGCELRQRATGDRRRLWHGVGVIAPEERGE